MLELKIPEAGESIQEVQIGQWLCEEGQWVEKDQELVELETDKASMELPAPDSGVLVKILLADGEISEPGAVIGHLDETQRRCRRIVGASPQPAQQPRPKDLGDRDVQHHRSHGNANQYPTRVLIPEQGSSL